MNQFKSEFRFKMPFDWESAALRQLQAEYLAVLQERNLGLAPARLVLMDSDDLWGQWDATTRTISLARKLVKDHSWFHVLGVMRHEIAHQYVSESALSRNEVGMDHTPHGARFHRACRLIGVPDELAGASADLQTESPDWRGRQRDPALDKLLERVKKLLALATSSNEHEALLAMNKVRELYAKHNLEQAPLSERPRFSHVVVGLPKRRIEIYHRKIFEILSRHFFVKVLTFKQYDARTGASRPAFELIGTSENTLMAEYVFHFLLFESDYLVRERAGENESRLTRIERKSYRLGILTGFEEKLARSEYVVAPVTPSRPTMGRELSVIGRAIEKFRADTDLQNYLSTVYPRLSKRSTMLPMVDEEAFDAGRLVGRSITLQKAVTEAASGQGRFLDHK